MCGGKDVLSKKTNQFLNRLCLINCLFVSFFDFLVFFSFLFSFVFIAFSLWEVAEG